MITFPDDDHRRLSNHLWEILDKIGLSPDVREVRTHTAITDEILKTLAYKLTGNGSSHYNVGSACEATALQGDKSDTDILYVYEKVPVVGDLHNARQHGLSYLLVRDSSTPAGYTKLQWVIDGHPATTTVPGGLEHVCGEDKHGRAFMTNRLMADSPPSGWQANGPAMTYLDIDNVMAYRCTAWPDCAMEWLTRARRHNWPPQHQIEKLRSLGCFLVLVGHRHSEEQHLEFRISFSRQERELMLSLNEVQYKCYYLLKLVKHDKISAHLGDSITSYHCKTLLFYAIEATPAEFWIPDNLVKCVLHCLHALSKCVESGVCANYFIPEANLFDSRIHGDLREQVADILHGILQEHPNRWFHIMHKDDGIHLVASNARGDELTPASTAIPTELQSTRLKNESYAQLRLSLMMTYTKMLQYAVVSNNTATCIDRFQAQLAQLSSTSRVSEHTEAETRDAVSYLLPLLHTNLASHLAARLLQTPGDAAGAGNIRRVIDEHIQQATASTHVCTLCRLKVAAIYYRLAEYTASESMLSAVSGVLCPFINHECVCQSHCLNEFLLDERATEETVDTDASCCVSFLPTEMALAPTALQYEIFKSAGKPTKTRERAKTEQRYAWGNVDGIVFLPFIQYLVYDKLADVSQRQQALTRLEHIVRTDAFLYHRETAFNLLGWILKMEGDDIRAAACFAHSISLEPVHNAARWHIGDLYLRQAVSTIYTRL